MIKVKHILLMVLSFLMISCVTKKAAGNYLVEDNILKKAAVVLVHPIDNDCEFIYRKGFEYHLSKKGVKDYSKVFKKIIYKEVGKEGLSPKIIDELLGNPDVPIKYIIIDIKGDLFYSLRLPNKHRSINTVGQTISAQTR